MQESGLKIVWTSSEKRRILSGQNNDGDGGVVEEKEKRSPKRKWLHNTRNDLSERTLSDDEAQCRVNGKRLIRNIDPTYNVKGCVKGRQFLFT